MSTLLRLEHISYQYDTGEHALSNLSFSISAGERIAILGNNGAGKSTLFLCCNGVLKPSQGTIFLNETPVSSKKDLMNLRRHVAFVFQDPEDQLIGGTVAQEVSFGPMNLGLPRTEVAARVDESLDAMHLQAYRERAPHYLSGGEKKRVTLADALAMQPQILLLDEPAASLDPENAARLEDTLASLHQAGLALVISTHDVDFAWRWADRLLLLHAGQLEADGAPAEIFSQPSLLSLCGLEQPLLFRVAAALNYPGIPPRTPEAFAALRS